MKDMKALCIVVVLALARSSALPQESALMRRVMQVEEDIRIVTMPMNALQIDRQDQPVDTNSWNDDGQTDKEKVTTHVTKKVITTVTTDQTNVSRSEEKYTGPHPIEWYVGKSSAAGESNSTEDTNASDTANITSNSTANITSNSTGGANVSGNMSESANKSDTWVPMPSSSGNSGTSSQAGSQARANTNMTANSSGVANESATGASSSVGNKSKDSGDWFKAENATSDNDGRDDWFKSENRSSRNHDDWFKTNNGSSGNGNGGTSYKYNRKDGVTNYSSQDNSANSYWSNWSWPGGNWSMPHFDIGMGNWSWPEGHWPSWNSSSSSHQGNWQTSSHESHSTSATNGTSESSDGSNVDGANSGDANSDDSKSSPSPVVYPVPSPTPTPTPTTTLPLDRSFSVGDN
mmetsp:Transcript_17502/g.28063  ORF Transcript_17502/g.28063 Transcript_17502/m.28063 type:complete len:405 (-) Transcript_17502:42-1256(-)